MALRVHHKEIEMEEGNVNISVMKLIILGISIVYTRLLTTAKKITMCI